MDHYDLTVIGAGKGGAIGVGWRAQQVVIKNQ